MCLTLQYNFGKDKALINNSVDDAQIRTETSSLPYNSVDPELLTEPKNSKKCVLMIKSKQI